MIPAIIVTKQEAALLDANHGDTKIVYLPMVAGSAHPMMLRRVVVLVQPSSVRSELK